METKIIIHILKWYKNQIFLNMLVTVQEYQPFEGHECQSFPGG